MIFNKTPLPIILILITSVINSQTLIQAGSLKDLKLSPKIAIAGGGTPMDWANLEKYKNNNKELIKVPDENRVVFMGNSITENWSSYRKDFSLTILLLIEVLEVKPLHKC